MNTVRNWFALALILTAAAFAEPPTDKLRIAVSFDGVGDSVMVPGQGYGTAGFQIAGTWTGTIQFSGSIDGTNWVGLTGYNAASRAGDSTTTENGIFFVGTSGTRYVKAIMTARSSGTATVTAITTDDIAVLTSASASGGGGGGAEGSVDVLSIAAGNNNIGNVDVVTLPNVTLAAGTNTNEVVGDAAHDAAAAGNPLSIGGTASAAAPTSVSADGDAVRAWYLRNGSAATTITAAGALVGGDATNGLDVDVTRLPALVAGTANIGDVDVLTVPTDPFGANADAASATGSISAKLRYIASTGIPVTNAGIFATQAAQSGNWSVRLQDGSGNSISSTSNNLNVQCANCSGSGASATDEASFTAGSSTFAPSGVFYQTTATNNALTNGQQGMLQATAQRAAFVNLRNASGTEVGTSGAPVRTDPTGTTAQPVTDNGGSLTVDYATTGSGTATGALRVELPTNGTGVIATVGAVTSITNALPAGNNNVGDVDVASIAAGNNNIGDVDIASAPTGSSSITVQGTAAADAATVGSPVYMGGRASAAAPSDVSADGDVVPDWHLRNGAQATVLTAAGALIGGDATNGVDADVTRAFGQAAHDAAIAGAPFRIGLRAATSDYTAVATGDQADALGTIDGKLVTKPHAIRASSWTYAAASGGITNTTAATIRAAVASNRACLTSIQVINGHATVSTEVLVRDGAAGTVLHRGFAQAAGGGYAANFDVPICGTANTLMEVVPVTTGSAIYVNAQGYISQE